MMNARPKKFFKPLPEKFPIRVPHLNLRKITNFFKNQISKEFKPLSPKKISTNNLLNTSKLEKETSPLLSANSFRLFNGKSALIHNHGKKMSRLIPMNKSINSVRRSSNFILNEKSARVIQLFWKEYKTKNQFKLKFKSNKSLEFITENNDKAPKNNNNSFISWNDYIFSDDEGDSFSIKVNFGIFLTFFNKESIFFFFENLEIEVLPEWFYKISLKFYSENKNLYHFQIIANSKEFKQIKRNYFGNFLKHWLIKNGLFENFKSYYEFFSKNRYLQAFSRYRINVSYKTLVKLEFILTRIMIKVKNINGWKIIKASEINLRNIYESNLIRMNAYFKENKSFKRKLVQNFEKIEKHIIKILERRNSTMFDKTEYKKKEEIKSLISLRKTNKLMTYSSGTFLKNELRKLSSDSIFFDNKIYEDEKMESEFNIKNMNDTNPISFEAQSKIMKSEDQILYRNSIDSSSNIKIKSFIEDDSKFNYDNFDNNEDSFIGSNSEEDEYKEKLGLYDY